VPIILRDPLTSVAVLVKQPLHRLPVSLWRIRLPYPPMAALRRAEDMPPLPWLELSPAIPTLSHLSNVARAARAKRARCSGADLASGLLDLSWLSSVAALSGETNPA
jgi:hypothetical protein